MPSNHMTPTIFARKAVDLFGKLDSHLVSAEAHDETWAHQQGMNSFLAVSQGSREPPVFLEITYNNLPEKEKPIVIVGKNSVLFPRHLWTVIMCFVNFIGKGITFDTGGISIKPSANMDKMRGDMGGAACTLATILTAAKLGLPLYLKGFNLIFFFPFS